MNVVFNRCGQVGVRCWRRLPLRGLPSAWQALGRQPVLVGLAALVLAGCSSGPPVPDWQVQTHHAADRATQAQLSGHDRVAEAEWARANQQAARSAQPEAVARVRLARCAAQRASLDWQPCEGLAALLPDASPALQAYARYLQGQWLPADVALLPPAQQAVARQVGAVAASGAAEAALRAVADPHSRLLAASVLVRAGQASPAVLALATDTASAQGWARPLLAWLALQLQGAEQAGQVEDAQRLRRRLDVLAPR